MCTASWLLNANGYQVFFNRDEQIGRAKALPPAQFTGTSRKASSGSDSAAGIDELAQVRYLMPVDPVGQGSWIACNEFGLTLCLLNYYQGDTPTGELISRGQLIKSFAHYTSADRVARSFEALDLTSYAPFTLVMFDPQLSALKGHVRALQWDGKSLIDSLPLPPLISSAVDADNVRRARRQLFAECHQDEATAVSRLAFHHSHLPERGHLSPCMHREDAHTVSFTHILVTESDVSIDYQDGSPCLGAPYQSTRLSRRANDYQSEQSA